MCWIPRQSQAVKDAESYVNNHKSYPTSYLYDKAFHIDEGYNAKLKRDNRLLRCGQRGKA